MNPTTKSWGIKGAVTVTILGGTLVLVQMLWPHDLFAESTRSALYHLVWEGVCYPVTLIWEGVFRVRAIEGDARMIYIIPIAASALLYFGCVGFGLGVLLKKLLRAA